MANPIVLTCVQFRSCYKPGDLIVTIECRDELTQEFYPLCLPRHALPTLARLIADLVEAHPEDFPELVASRTR